MNEDEANTPDSGTDDIAAQTPDTPADWDYYDPAEDTVEAPEDAATEDGTDEAAQEAEISEPVEVEAALDAVVTMADGSKITVGELAKSNFRQADYTRKTQEFSQRRQALEANVQTFEGVQNAFIEYLSKLVPEAPDHSLALRDAAAYTRQMAQHQAALAQVQKLVETGEQVKQVKESITSEQRAESLAEENRKLAERFPTVSTKDGREKFFNKAADAATEIGFSLDELAGISDHRIFAALQYAKIGMDAMKARTEAKAKVQAAPQISPRKPGQSGQGSKSAEAMQKLARSGSFKDALKVDWE
jgi:hypothetical protein